MNISYHWLKHYIDFEYSPQELAHLLTACGLEVESIEPYESVKGGLLGLVVGEVLEASKHPNADRLTVTKVNLGNDSISQIVCGAPNVAVGQKVIVATPGTILYPAKGEPFEIKKSKIRGEASEGMICAEDEIGLGDGHEGILVLGADALPGMPAANYFNIENDFTLSIGLTPNRSDAASHIGVARDLKAVMNTLSMNKDGKISSLNWPDVSTFSTPEKAPVVNVEIEDEACTRYSGVHIKNIKVTDSPDWLQHRIKAIGLSPINNVVDITNFVLYELGQPLHAFDAAKITNKKIIVKRLKPDSKFTTLDGVERKLNGTEMMICDDEGGMCIAGVFGGIGSGVGEATNEVFLESACFDAVSIRKTSKLHGLKTDASFRFERGTDPNMTIVAMQRAALLICEIAGGEISSSIVDIYTKPVKNWKMDFAFSNFQKLTGVDLSKESFIRILSWLDIHVISESNGIMNLEVPPYRVDVMREADIVEEVLRIYGYNNIPLPSKLNASLPSPPMVKLEKTRNQIASLLVANGFYEVMSNSLYRSSAFADDISGLVKIKNPLSQDLDVMRANMLFPLLDLALYNRNRKRSDIRVFEYGKTYFHTEAKYVETNHLALLLTGKKQPLHWSGKSEDYNVYFLKSLVNNMVSIANVKSGATKWEMAEHDQLQSTMHLKQRKHVVATIGQVKKKVLKQFDLDGDVWYIDVNLDVLERLINDAPVKIAEPPKYPEVRRDLSMVLDKSVQYQALEDLAFEMERKLLVDVSLFDVFEGEKIGNDKKSYALSFVLRDDEKTLTEKDIDKVMQRLMDGFEKKLGAVIRKG